MLTGKNYLQRFEEEELNYVMMCKPEVVMMRTTISDLPEEIQIMLVEFSDIVVDDLANEFPP